jgi:hypothetical protein
VKKKKKSLYNSSSHSSSDSEVVNSDNEPHLQADRSKDPTKVNKNEKCKVPDSVEKANGKKTSHTKHTEKLISLP